jgi:hypothetical protein
MQMLALHRDIQSSKMAMLRFTPMVKRCHRCPDAPQSERSAEIAIGSYLNYHVYTENGAVIVDGVVRYEDLWRRIGVLAKEFRIEMPEPLPRAKGHRRPAMEILTGQQKPAIQSAAAFEFDLLGYTA